MTDDSGVCECSHPFSAHEHQRAGSECSLCLCARYRPPALITPRTLRTFAGGAAVCGLVMILAPWHPLAGLLLLVAAGLAAWSAKE